jgi:regulator of sigma E protease
MSGLSNILYIALLIFVVVMSFNVIIFVHELGHFLAAKWRGLQIDRFQIWFGKPIWKKTIKGVQYGLGWIPAGGFVALPQMAPMESIEGKNSDDKPLAPIKPIDKIIVAAAGPLFSLLLALAAAGIVSQIGKPIEFIPSTEIGEVDPNSPAQEAGLLVGDKVLQINGEDVSVFQGQLDGVFERIVLSKGDEIEFKIQRPGVAEPIVLNSKFRVPPTQWYERRALRQVGIGPINDYVMVAAVMKGGPAEKAGLKEGDRLRKINGTKIHNGTQFLALVKEAAEQPITLEYLRPLEEAGKKKSDAGTISTVTLQAEVPVSPPGKPLMIGLGPVDVPLYTSQLKSVPAWTQVKDSVNMMWVTLNRLLSPKSSISLDHLSGPVGIAKVQYQMLQMDYPIHRLLAFFVLFNVNLAVLNMLPFPVLDGGHIVLATMEAVTRRTPATRIMEWVQTVFALALISVMLYVTSKDLFGDSRKMEKIVFEQK